MNAQVERRVVVTGMGVISPLGNSIESLWDHLEQGISGIRPLRRLPTQHLHASYGGEAWDFDGGLDAFGPLDKKFQRTIKKALKVMCREIQMGVAAAQQALHQAQLAPEDRVPERTGVVYGSDYMMTLPEEFAAGIQNCLDEQAEFEFSRWGEDGLPKVDPLWLLKYLPNMPASHIAIFNDLRGPNNSLTVREASANLAIGEAYTTIMRGHADVMLAGATGTRIHPLRTLHVILQEELAGEGEPPETMCRPFDLRRQGMVVGEGAGAMVLESLESAEARGATIWGEVVGHGSSSVLQRNGLACCDQAVNNVLRQSLRSAHLTPDQVGHIHAHGLATRRADCDEARAIADVFQGVPVPVTAAKSYCGNLGAAGGVVEAIASLLAMHHQRLFPVLNYREPDPNCPVAVCREPADPGDVCVNVNFSPQGQASAVVFKAA